MNFPKFQRLVEERTGFRTMENATASGEYFSDSCGDMYNFFLKVGPGAVIEDISYFTTGCGFGTATCSLVVELAKGKTIDEASAITAGEIESQLDGYPEKKKDYPERALEALQVAIDRLSQQGFRGFGSRLFRDAARSGTGAGSSRHASLKRRGRQNAHQAALI